MRPGNRHRVPAILLGFKWKTPVLLTNPRFKNYEFHPGETSKNPLSAIHRQGSSFWSFAGRGSDCLLQTGYPGKLVDDYPGRSKPLSGKSS